VAMPWASSLGWGKWDKREDILKMGYMFSLKNSKFNISMPTWWILVNQKPDSL
jgi:hypothetical protein